MKPPHPTRRTTRLTLITIALLLAYGLSLRAVEIDLPGLVRGLPNGLALLADFAIPDLFTRDRTQTQIALDFPVPCGATSVAPPPEQGPRLVPAVDCAAVGDIIPVEGFELPPGADVRLVWLLQGAADQRLRAAAAETDHSGYFRAEVEVRPLVATEDGRPSQLLAEISQTGGTIRPSPALLETIDATLETLFMALVATTLALLLAAPLGFLGAANVMAHGRSGKLVYYFARGLMNTARTFEPLVLATIFGLWVGFGPFAGVLALAVFTVASLGKLFSEVVENIDPGPVEAVAATGASRLAVVVYAIVPQVIPEFVSFTIYHWDINVRVSTIIGFVGGGGIGHLLDTRLKSFAYHQAGTAVWAIVLVVWALDVFSSVVRRRIV